MSSKGTSYKVIWISEVHTIRSFVLIKPVPNDLTNQKYLLFLTTASTSSWIHIIVRLLTENLYSRKVYANGNDPSE